MALGDLTRPSSGRSWAAPSGAAVVTSPLRSAPSMAHVLKHNSLAPLAPLGRPHTPSTPQDAASSTHSGSIVADSSETDSLCSTVVSFDQFANRPQSASRLTDQRKVQQGIAAAQMNMDAYMRSIAEKMRP
eukprot:TRINITY_DN14278_c0_g1_i1.p2 TRINITY_DN14278_c0_g1~~TRINITY_DN14278_c0_g1_i1.p2  ORF type:complete len:131 (+),score=24.41 TRINITY_DN14278_c0_g1_i1:102-494(+)